VSKNKHEFAIFYPDLTQTLNADSISCNDKTIINRISHVLRLYVDDVLILFDEQNHATATISALSKKEVAFKILNSGSNKKIEPSIRVALPILKKDAFEESIYNITELGGSEIQLIETQKAQRSWGGDKEMERLKRITIAAAEQSKNFAMPPIHQPISLQQLLKQGGTIMFCDVNGEPIWQVFNQKLRESVTIIIGPEGDLADEEKKLLENSNVKLYRLTPTILRSVQAVSVALGYLRCLN